METTAQEDSLVLQHSNNVSNDSFISRHKTSEEWVTHIKGIQKQHMTPEVLENIRGKAEQVKRASKAFKTAEIMERANTLNSRAQVTSLRQAKMQDAFKNSKREVYKPEATKSAPMFGFHSVFGFSDHPHAPAPPQALDTSVPDLSEKKTASHFDYDSIQQRNMMHSTAIMNSISARRQFKASATIESDDEAEVEQYMTVSRQLEALEEEVDAEDKFVQTVAAEVVASASGAITGVNREIAETSLESFDSLLESLAKEPTDELEMAAKFTLFENYLSTVTLIREQTLQFWEENKIQFEGTARSAGDQSMKQIDNENSMAIEENTRKWFVYLMMKKSHKNSAAISDTLAGLKAKLQLLASQEIDCPFCLETITIENTHVLSCCHKSCKDCWQHWVQLKGPRAFCPLCRHDQFVEDILSEA